MSRILGYADRISASPGEDLQIKVSCDGLDEFDAELIRVIHGDINPAGPGYRHEVIDVDLGGPFPGRYQPIHTGSFARIDDPPSFDTGTSIGLQLLIWPTLPGTGEQTLLCQENTRTGAGFRLYIDEAGSLAFTVSGPGESLGIVADAVLVRERWYRVGVSHDADNGVVSISQQPLIPTPGIADCGVFSITTGKPVSSTVITDPVFMAARPGDGGSTRQCFNGRIENPRIYTRALEPEELNRADTESQEDVLANWDFSIEMSTDRVTDISGNGVHGRLVNLPTRGVTGHRWSGDENCWKRKPGDYAAIHFHDDDLYDCGWETDIVVSLPHDIPSAVYAIRLFSADHEYFVVFAVRSPRDKPTAPVALLLPTASYLAYANNRIGIDVPETEIVCGGLLQMNPVDLFMQTHPELGLCFYDVHNDGSGVYYSSRLRPIINMQPRNIGHLGGSGSNVWQFNADTHILDWLERIGQPFDVITDEDLEEDGVSALENYRVVMTGTHPEYYSANMLDSLQEYLGAGGRLMYLGGNGFYWRVSFHPELPGVIECRKSEDGIRAFAPLPGEYYCSFTGEYSGLWRRNGRPPNALVGVGMVSQGFDRSAPYIRTEASHDQRVAFVFDGVENRVIGDYGLSGGGAAGLELDATDHQLGTPMNTLVLARSERHSDVYLMTPEDMNDPAPGLGGSEAEKIRAEMVFFETPGGGAVFSTGSIAWSGSLSHDSYNNDVSRITRNVLNRFLDETPFESGSASRGNR